MHFKTIVTQQSYNIEQSIAIIAPATGQVYKIEGNEFLSLAEGIKIKLENEQIISPIKGKVLDIHPSCGKLIIETSNHLKFQLQLPNEYSQFMGLGIKPLVKKGQSIQIKTPLLQLDLYKIKLKMKPIFLYFMTMNNERFQAIEVPHKHVTVGEDIIFSLLPKHGISKATTTNTEA